MQKASHKIIFVFCSLSFNKSNKRALFLSNLISGFVKLLIEKVFVLRKLYSSNNLPISVFLPILVIGLIFRFLSFTFFLVYLSSFKINCYFVLPFETIFIKDKTVTDTDYFTNLTQEDNIFVFFS